MNLKASRFLSVAISLCMIMCLLPIGSITVSAENSYGTFNVSADGNVFTVTRTGGTTGKQRVYYRTVSQSATEGTHYKAAYGSITFNAGEGSKAVTVTEYGSTTSQIYDGRHSTGYSNAARTYRLEIYQVSGGATLGDATSATRTMGEPTKISQTLFTASHTKDIKAAEVLRGDYDDDILGWGTKGIGTAAYESINIMNSLENRAYWEEVAEYLTFDVSVDIKEYNSGYQHIVLAEGSSFRPLIYPNDGEFVDKDGNITLIGDTSDSDGIFYSAVLEHGGGGSADKNYETYTIDAIIDETEDVKSAGIDSNYRSTNGHFIIKQKTDGHIAVKDDTLMVGFSGSGSGRDQFYTKNLKLINLKVHDTKQPRYLGIAPIEGDYRPGDKLTLSVVFDEIVTSGTDTMLSTPWGDFEYSGGVNTNVLYYTGKVPDDAIVGLNTLSDCSLKYSTYISDMAGNRGTLGQAMSVNVYVTGIYGTTLNGTNVTAEQGFGTTAAKYGNTWTGTIKANDGYTLPDTVTVTVDTLELPGSAYTYDKTTGTITISGQYVTGDIEIKADSVPNTYSASLSGEGVTAGDGFGADKVTYNAEWTGSISPEIGYSLPDTIEVVVGTYTMPNNEYTYDKATGKITVNKAFVKGSVIINANGVKNPITVIGEVKGSGTSYEYSFEMASPDEVVGTFIVALYGEGKRLVGIETITMDNACRTYSKTNRITTDSTANTYKIMFWNDIMQPLGSAVSENVTQ